MKKEMCFCGKNPVAYIRDGWSDDCPKVRMCCVCTDTMITRIPRIKETLNIREIEPALNENEEGEIK